MPGDKSLVRRPDSSSLLLVSFAYPRAPSKICTYLYELANTFNSYYQKVKILQENSERLDSNIVLLSLMKRIFESGIELLGFEAPERM